MVLIFIHASRSQNWKLHQSSTDDLARDITSMDLKVSAHATSVYLAEMCTLKRRGPVVCEAFSDGEFIVQTNKIPFTGVMDRQTGKK